MLLHLARDLFTVELGVAYHRPAASSMRRLLTHRRVDRLVADPVRHHRLVLAAGRLDAGAPADLARPQEVRPF